MNDRNITKLSIFQISHRLSFFKRWWRVFSEAVKGSDRDYTEIPLNKAVFLLAIPMVLEMAMESIFAIVDIFFVSSFK